MASVKLDKRLLYKTVTNEGVRNLSVKFSELELGRAISSSRSELSRIHLQ